MQASGRFKHDNRVTGDKTVEELEGERPGTGFREQSREMQPTKRYPDVQGKRV